MIKSFGKTLAAIIRKKKLSVSAVSDDLGFSSKTALFRIIRDESKPSSIKKCLEMAKQSAKLNLTEEEVRELENALKVSTIGAEAYAVGRIFEEILYPKPLSVSQLRIPLENCEEGEYLEDLLNFYRPLKQIRLTFYGSCTSQFLSRVYAFTKEADVSIIQHVLNLDDRNPEDISALGAASNILFMPMYQPCLMKMTDNPEQNWFFRSGQVLISGGLPDGKRCAHQLTPLKSGAFFSTRSDNGSLQKYWRRMFEEVRDRANYIKHNQDNVSKKPFPQNYIDFTEGYYQIENNREIYMIKPDLPICFIPPQVIRAPVEEGLQKMSSEEHDQALLEQMYDVQVRRFANIFEKTKDTHIVLNRDAMRQFAMTGRREDLVFFSRPYTPQERVLILENLLEQMKKNKYFHVWFSRDDSFSRDREVTSYDGIGVAVIRADTSWNLEKDHQEIFIQNKMMTRCFKQFMTHEILKKNVLSKEESVCVVEELLEIARSCEE